MTGITVGIQSVNDRILKDVYRRNVSRRSVSECARILQKYFAPSDEVRFDVIVDSPWETDADRRETIHQLNALERFFRLSVFGLVLFPGTPLYDRAIAEAIPQDHKSDPYAEQYSYRRSPLNRLLHLVPELSPATVQAWLDRLDKPGGEALFNLWYPTTKFTQRVRLAASAQRLYAP